MDEDASTDRESEAAAACPLLPPISSPARSCRASTTLVAVSIVATTTWTTVQTALDIFREAVLEAMPPLALRVRVRELELQQSPCVTRTRV